MPKKPTPQVKPELKGTPKQKGKIVIEVAKKRAVVSPKRAGVKSQKNAKRPTSTLKPKGTKVEVITPPHELQRFVPEAKTGGRPTSITLEVIISMKSYFMLGCTIEEAARASGISKQTFYNYVEALEVSLRDDFLDLVEAWRDETVIKARRTIVDSLNDPESAKWYLARKRKDEFATRTQQDVREVDDFANLDDADLKKIANAAAAATDRL